MWNWTTTGNRSFHNQFLPSSDYSSQIYVEVMEWLHPSEIPRVEEHCLEALELLKKYRVDGVRVGWESTTYTLLHSCSSNSGNWPQSHARCSRIRSGVLPPLPMSSMANAAKPMYLLWHSCGECNTICACKHDHVQYSDHELVPMHNWCNTNIKEWRAGGSLYQPVINDVQSKLKIHCPSFVPSLSYQSSVATLSSSNKTSDNHRQSRSSYVYCSWCSIVKEAWLKKKKSSSLEDHEVTLQTFLVFHTRPSASFNITRATVPQLSSRPVPGRNPRYVLQLYETPINHAMNTLISSRRSLLTWSTKNSGSFCCTALPKHCLASVSVHLAFSHREVGVPDGWWDVNEDTLPKDWSECDDDRKRTIRQQRGPHSRREQQHGVDSTSNKVNEQSLVRRLQSLLQN